MCIYVEQSDDEVVSVCWQDSVEHRSLRVDYERSLGLIEYTSE